MLELPVPVIVTLTFLLAGGVKGVIGMGLPSVSLALLTVAIDLPTAMVLMLVPSFITNLWQALAGGQAMQIIRSMWPFLLAATATIWIGTKVLVLVDANMLSGLLGGLLAAYALINLIGYRPSLDSNHSGWIGTLFGAVNGVLTGMTGSFVVPGVMYLQASGLPRDMLIQTMGILFTLSTVALALALQRHQLINQSLLLLSSAALIPAIIGMWIGQRIRKRLSERQFRKVFFVSLLLLATYIILSSTGIYADTTKA